MIHHKSYIYLCFRYLSVVLRHTLGTFTDNSYDGKNQLEGLFLIQSLTHTNKELKSIYNTKMGQN